MAKMNSYKAGQFAVDKPLQLLGPTGYSKKSTLEYLYRCVRGWRIPGGTIEVQRNTISTELKKYGPD